jgi:hypothetical protein
MQVAYFMAPSANFSYVPCAWVPYFEAWVVKFDGAFGKFYFGDLRSGAVL